MITIRLRGGMGNQFFQYALGLVLAEKHNTRLRLDLSCYPDHKNRSFNLDRFQLNCELVSVPFETPNVRERFFHFDPAILELGNDVFLDGYWQSEKYFKDYEQLIRDKFSFLNRSSDLNLAKQIESGESVAVQVRRGDYVTDPQTTYVHGITPIDWFLQACEFVRVHTANPQFYIFTDDPTWEGLKPLGGEIVGADLYEEMQLMTRCQHFAISNSTFGWWGAWLSRRKGLRIVPDPWFANAPHDTSDLIPDGWIRLHHGVKINANKTLIAIESCHKHRHLHSVQRDTWIKHVKDTDADVRFFMGLPESEIEPDEVVLQVGDDYDSLVYKTHAIITWAIEHGYQRMFKCDSDTFIVPERMFASDYASHSFVSYYWPPNPLAGWFAFPSGGAGYWLDRKAMEIIASTNVRDMAWHENKIQPEDCAVARILGHKGISLYGDDRYSPEMNMGFPTLDNDFITTHRVSPEQMIYLQSLMNALPRETLTAPRIQRGAIVFRNGKKIQLDTKGNPINELA